MSDYGWHESGANTHRFGEVMTAMCPAWPTCYVWWERTVSDGRDTRAVDGEYRAEAFRPSMSRDWNRPWAGCIREGVIRAGSLAEACARVEAWVEEEWPHEVA